MIPLGVRQETLVAVITTTTAMVNLRRGKVARNRAKVATGTAIFLAMSLMVRPTCLEGAPCIIDRALFTFIPREHGILFGLETDTSCSIVAVPTPQPRPSLPSPTIGKSQLLRCIF